MDGIGTILDKVQAWGGMTAMLVVLAAVFLVYLIQCFPRVSDGFLKFGARKRRERMARRDRLDAFFTKPVNLSLSSDPELESFLQRERRLAIIEEFSGIEMSEKYAAAFLKLHAMGKVRISRIRKAWMSLEIDEKNGELRWDHSKIDYVTVFLEAFSFIFGIGSLIKWCWLIENGSKEYGWLLIAIEYVACGFIYRWLGRSGFYARKIEKEVYGKTSAKGSKPSQPMENAAGTADGIPTPLP